MGGTYVYQYIQDDFMIENKRKRSRKNKCEPIVTNNMYSCYKLDYKIVVEFERGSREQN